MHLKTHKSRNSPAAALCSRVPPAHLVLAGGGRGQSGSGRRGREVNGKRAAGRVSQMGERYLFGLWSILATQFDPTVTMCGFELRID